MAALLSVRSVAQIQISKTAYVNVEMVFSWILSLKAALLVEKAAKLVIMQIHARLVLQVSDLELRCVFLVQVINSLKTIRAKTAVSTVLSVIQAPINASSALLTHP